MNTIQNAAGREILLSMVRAIQSSKDYLGEVDGLIGDGDHGMNMNKGFSLFAEELGEKSVSLSDGLFDLGTVLLNRIGGSMGPIYGTVFMDMSDRADGLEEITLADFADMLEAGLEGLYGIVEARQGDKTLVDTLAPAVASLRAAQETDASFAHALKAMKTAAEEGKNSTKELTAKFGRSARLGERSRGVLDAGATSCCLILQAMADGMLALLTGEGEAQHA